jgi:hypothetical protein
MPCVGSRFKPLPNETILIGGQSYTVQPHPMAPTSPFSAEGRRATVYNLRGVNGQAFAFKVFKKTFRTPALLESATLLARFSSMPGMLAASRTVIGPSDQAAIDCGDLLYSTLMPWIPGSTWNDVLMDAERGRQCYGLDTGMRLCARFLGVMEALEKEGVAHTDIAPGNLTVSVKSAEVQLLDLEDIYVPGIPQPPVRNTGTAGYRHPSADGGQTTWCQEGDRFATAVMAAEMLILSNPVLGRQSSDTGYFGGDHTTAVGAQRFDAAYPFLRSTAPEFAEVFHAAWLSASLDRCPPASALHKALASAPAPKQSVQVPGVEWGAFAAPPPPPPPPRAAAASASAGGGSQFWSQEPAGAGPSPTAAQSSASQTPKPAAGAGVPKKGNSAGAWGALAAFVVIGIIGVAGYQNYEQEQQRIHLQQEERDRESARIEAQRQEEARKQKEAEQARQAEVEARKPSAMIGKVSADHNALNDGERGIRFNVAFSVNNLKDKPGEVLLLFFYNDSTEDTPVINANGRCFLKDTSQLCAHERFTPPYDKARYDDFAIFIPYTDIFSVSGAHTKFKVRVFVRSLDGGITVLGSDETVLFEKTT